MKTKHFLITTEDGSAVAVVEAQSELEFLDKAETCIREQLDYPKLIVIDFKSSDCFLKCIRRENSREDIMIINYKRIEIY